MEESSKDPVKDLVNAFGTLGEMAHVIYTSMLNAGADRVEATAGMQGFIHAWWSDAMNNARRENQKDEQDE